MKTFAIPMACIIALSWCAPASATMTLKAFRKLDQGETKRITEVYVTGIGRGIALEDGVLIRQGKNHLFCVPQNLTMDSEIILSVLDQEIRSPDRDTSYKDDDLVEIIMLFALINHFPCK